MKIVSIVLVMNIVLTAIAPFFSIGGYLKPVSAQSPSGTVDFLYDGGGQRIAKIVDGGDHVYYVDNLEITVKADGTTSWKRYYGGAIREKTPQEEKVYYVASDHLGSTSQVYDEQGNVVSQQVYFPYGTTRTSEGTLPTEREYTGQVSDQDETGLYYYNARYYNPTLGKFTQADKANDGFNKYAYVGNDPINKNDPTGNCYDPPCPGQGQGGPLDEGNGGGGGSSDSGTTPPSWPRSNPIPDQVIYPISCAYSRDPTYCYYLLNGGSDVTWSDLSTDQKAITASVPFLAGGLASSLFWVPELVYACLGSGVCTRTIVAVEAVDTATDVISCFNGDQQSCFFLGYQGADTLNDFLNFLDTAAGLIKAKRYTEAISFLENEDFATKIGLNLDLDGRTYSFNVAVNNPEQVKYWDWTMNWRYNIETHTILLESYDSKYPTDFLYRENALLNFEEWHHAYQHLSGVDIDSWEVDVADFLRNAGVDLEGSRWVQRKGR